MPWRAGRRWWCGCDGSNVRRRRATGRRGWRGGVGCGCTSSPTGRWRSRGRRGPSRGRRARTGPALAGTCPGPRRRRLRRRSPRLRPMPRCPRRRVARCRAMDRYWLPWSLWWTRPPGGRPPSRCFRAWIACSRAPSTKPVSMRLLVAQPTMRPARTGPVTKAVQQNPDQVGT